MMNILDLPSEILASIPHFIRNIEDFNNLACSCRTFRNAFASTPPRTILHLAAVSAPTFFSPHPHFLVMATARQISDWAVGNQERTLQLEHAFRGGIDSLYDLCLQHCGLTMSDIRRLHLSRFSTINPLSDRIDKMAGQQWYQTPNFWNGGVSEAATLHTDSDRATFQFIIYGELFGSSLRAYIDSAANLPRFSLRTRLEFIKYCIPDWTCKRGYAGFEVQQLGPYQEGGPEILPGDQIAIQHILTCSRWTRMWEQVTKEIGPDFSDEWRQDLWWNSLQTLGLDGAELVVTADAGISDAWKERLGQLRTEVEQLDGQRHIPSMQKIGTHMQFPLSDAPNLAKEVRVCMAGYWGAR